MNEEGERVRRQPLLSMISLAIVTPSNWIRATTQDPLYRDEVEKMRKGESQCEREIKEKIRVLNGTRHTAQDRSKIKIKNKIFKT